MLFEQAFEMIEHFVWPRLLASVTEYPLLSTNA
jgi:hypothetical protein